MKVLIVGDTHVSRYSSIVRSRGEDFSFRLQQLIKSLNWAEEVGAKHGCSREIFLGDFFDKPDLNSEEITALSRVKWNQDVVRYFIVGNHESGEASLRYSSTYALYHEGMVIDKPFMCKFGQTDARCLLIPYIGEDSRKPLIEYINSVDDCGDGPLYIFSHNDVKGFQMGRFALTSGFTIEEILANSKLYFNGHLHNCGWIEEDRILNVGVLCGQNFNEDATKYEHHIAILDTETGAVEFFENPYAFNFYKIEVNDEKDFAQLDNFKDNAVVTVKCSENLEEQVKEMLESNPKVCEYRLLISRNGVEIEVESTQVLSEINHLEQFSAFVLENIGDSEIIREELSEVCK